MAGQGVVVRVIVGPVYKSNLDRTSIGMLHALIDAEMTLYLGWE